MITWNQDVDAYIAGLPPMRRAAVSHLREVIINNLPDAFAESFDGLPAYVVAPAELSETFRRLHHIHVPSGTSYFSCVRFINTQDRVSLFYAGLDEDIDLQRWIEERCRQRGFALPDIAGCWMHFHHPQHMPFELVAELIRLHSTEDWVAESDIEPRAKGSERRQRTATN